MIHLFGNYDISCQMYPDIFMIERINTFQRYNMKLSTVPQENMAIWRLGCAVTAAQGA